MSIWLTTTNLMLPGAVGRGNYNKHLTLMNGRLDILMGLKAGPNPSEGRGRLIAPILAIAVSEGQSALGVLGPACTGGVGRLHSHLLHLLSSLHH
jgi:hypothetical protein